MAPTPATSCASLPPEDACSAWGRPGGGTSASGQLWLARHAQPLVEAGVCYGQHDVAADAAATARCAAALADVLPSGLRVAFSPLQRCVQLAEALSALRPDLQGAADARLQEMNFGRWEGRPWAGIAPAELQAWTDDFAGYAAGQDGENVQHFMARIAQAYDALGMLHDAPKGVLWITHAGVIRAVNLLARGVRQVTQADQWPRHAPEYGQWQTLALQISRMA